MAFDPNKVYEIRLDTTGSDVNSVDSLLIKASDTATPTTFFALTTLTGSLSPGGSNVILGGSSSVSNWQSGIQISGSDIRNAYEAASGSLGSGVTLQGVILENQTGNCEDQASPIFLFTSVVDQCYKVSLLSANPQQQEGRSDICAGTLDDDQPQDYFTNSPNLATATELYTTCVPQKVAAPDGIYGNSILTFEVLGDGNITDIEEC